MKVIVFLILTLSLNLYNAYHAQNSTQPVNNTIQPAYEANLRFFLNTIQDEWVILLFHNKQSNNSNQLKEYLSKIKIQVPFKIFQIEAPININLKKTFRIDQIPNITLLHHNKIIKSFDGVPYHFKDLENIINFTIENHLELKGVN